MPVGNVTINNIAAKRLVDSAVTAGIDHKVAINSVEETDLKAIGKKGLKMGFEFGTHYNDEKKNVIGEITITGDVIFVAENTAELLMAWKKDKKLPEDVNLQCVNNVIRRCMGKAIVLSEDLSLPSPVPIPFLQKEPAKDDKSRYIG